MKGSCFPFKGRQEAGFLTRLEGERVLPKLFEPKVPRSSPEKIFRLNQEQRSVAEILWLKLWKWNVIMNKFPVVKGARARTANQYDD